MNLARRTWAWRFIVGLGLFSWVASSAPLQLSGTDSRAQALHAYAKLPLRFVENRGQTDARVRYHAQGDRYAFFLTREEIVLSFAKPSGPGRIDGFNLALRFIDANPQAALAGEERAPGTVNYLRGNDPSQWHTGLPGYAQVVYRELWPGVDLMLRGQGGELKYEFRVRPGARPADIALAYRGSTGLTLDDQGGLLIETARGGLRDAPPISYQEIAGERVPVASRYVLAENGDQERRYGFAVGASYDPDHALIIDPALDYSTFLGGAGGDGGNGIAVDAAGSAYVVGTTQSLNFPTTTGAFDRTAGDTINGPDAFVTKLNATGSALVYSTYLGGSGFDFGRAIAIDAMGNAYVTGKTQSANFPTTAGAFDRTANIPQTPRPQVIDDGFVTKLNAAGSALVYSTYLGGTDNDELRAIALDAVGNAFVAGETTSADYPVTAGAFDTVRSGEYDAFVTKLNTTGSALVYSTFLGGLLSENADGLVVDAANDAYLAGSTRSADFPTTAGAYDTTHNGFFDSFVARLDANGSTLVYSTFLGGTDTDFGGDVAIDADGNAYVAGGTLSPDFPTTPGAFDQTFAGGSAGFVAKVTPDGSALVYSTFLRGGGASAIAVDPAGNAWMTGGTSSADFPATPDAFDTSFNGSSDAVVLQLNASGSALLYSTFVGGAKSEGGRAIALDLEGSVYATGETHSADFPTTTGAFDRIWNGDPLIFWGDGFVLKLAGSGEPTPPPPPPTPEAPTLVSPADAAAPTQPVTLDWTDVTHATSYEVQVDNSSTIAAPFIANPTVTVSQASLSGLPAQQLWWRVRARNSAGVFGPFSSTRRFTPQATGAAVMLTVTATGRSGERITSNPAGINVTVGSTGSAGFTSGTSIRLSVASGRDAVWSGACSSGGNRRRSCTFTITGDASVTGNVR